MRPIERAMRAELERINLRVNHDVRYRSDPDLYGHDEWWEVAVSAGDCEDYALAKLLALWNAGWAIGALRIALCWTETREYHAVLTVDMPGDTLVLDNRSDRISTWTALTRAGYRWDRRQAAAGPGWVAITA